MSEAEIEDIFERILKAPSGPPLVIELGDGRPEPAQAKRPLPPALPEGDEPLEEIEGAPSGDEHEQSQPYRPPSPR